MAGAVVKVGPAGEVALARLADKAREYIGCSRSENTLRAYRGDWRHFCAWCEGRGLVAMPAAPETVALYLADHAEGEGALSVGTLQRRLASIAVAHQAAGHDDPTKGAAVKNVWKGIRRAKGTAPKGKAPVLTADLRRMVEELPEGILGTRDRALLLLGFAGGFRRSELVGLDRADVAITVEGAVVTIRRSKTDQEGEGRKVGIPYGSNPDTCPVRALAAWVDAAGIEDGPLFRPVNRHGQVGAGRLSGYAVALVVKRYAEKAGLDAARYAGHSLRAGLATSAANAGASERSIMAQTGHRSAAMVRRYIRDGSLFRENAAATVGL